MSGPFDLTFVRRFHRRSLSLWFFVGSVIAVLGFSTAALAQGIDNDLRGKVIVGYQGWFGAPGDGTGGGWRHYSRDPDSFRMKTTTVEMWPDLSEASPQERFSTGFRLKGGSAASVFSSANAETVARHFQWMRDYGIAGAALQRFGSDLRTEEKRAFRDRVLANCRAAAAANGRIWYLMYDLSGLEDDELFGVVAQDWRHLVASGDLRKDPHYAHYHGKPVVCLWGVGFNDRRKYSLSTCAKLVDFFKDDSTYGGNSVIVGVPYFWRAAPTGREPDSVPLAELAPILKRADVVSPWSVGRYGTAREAGEIGSRNIVPDLAWCRQEGLGYQPVLFPGFRWSNLTRTRGGTVSGGIPRLQGKFLSAQAASAIGAGAEMLYVAMFDEIDEGTAIFKVTDDSPLPEGSFLGYEGLSSDFYLRLVGRIEADLRSGIASRK